MTTTARTPPPRRRQRSLWVSFCLAASLVAPARAEAERAAAAEQPLDPASLPSLQLAVVYTMLWQVRPPAQSRDHDGHPYTIGILGKDLFGSDLDLVRGLKIGDRPVRIARGAEPAELEHCDAVFICRSESARLQEILQHFAGRPQILVSDIERFAHDGGLIGLHLVDDRVGFDLNLKTAAACRIDFDLRLLSLAHEVLR